MSLYNDIIVWSKNRPKFIKEGIRRIFLNGILSDDDIQELKIILEKEIQNLPLDVKNLSTSDIPSIENKTQSIPKLISIKKPDNIGLLYEESELIFNENGLNILFGENGTGKSTYSRILKHFCWSRKKNTSLKPNIYNNKSTQSVNINYSINSTIYNFSWTGCESDANLNNIYIYDSESSINYLTEDTEIDFKPVGIDVLEKLLSSCSLIEKQYEATIKELYKDKPLSSGEISNKTDIGKWYLSSDLLDKNEINQKIFWNDIDLNRKHELEKLINVESIKNINKLLIQQKVRYSNFYDDILSKIEILNEDFIKKIHSIKKDYFEKKEAYELFQLQLNGIDPLPGVASESWKHLWESAKMFALTELNLNTPTFPNNNIKYCVLCQQPLTNDANIRLERFNNYINDDSTQKLENSKMQIQKEIIELEKYIISQTDVVEEIEKSYSNINLLKFLDNFKNFKETLIKILQSEKKDEEKKLYESLLIPDKTCLEKIKNELDNIKNEIEKNENSIINQSSLLIEYEELKDRELLFKSLNKINEFSSNQSKIKTITSYINFIPKATITKEIGILQESESITQFNNLFLEYINKLSPVLAEKIAISKTKASRGKTYQRCFLKNHNKEKVVDILSEGEQKIVILANFLAECSLSNSNCTIVFDDPVTSLDYNYRDAISKLFVELSKDRQIIILTHDFYFTRLIIDTYIEATKKDDFKIISINRDENCSGIISSDFPYLLKNVNERISSIRTLMKKYKTIPQNRIDEKKLILGNLKTKFRECIEKTVENVLVDNSIQRFSKNINIKKKSLSTLICVEKEDVDFILKLFGRYSISEHDGTLEQKQITFLEFEEDLKQFEKWKTTFESKAKDYKKKNNYD